MELRPAYRRTEIGVFPSNWNIVSLGELFQFQNGVNAAKEAYGSGVPFINVLEVITNAHLRHHHIPGKVRLARGVVEVFAVSYGDLLFNRTSETQEEVALSAVYLGSEQVVFGGFVIRGKPRSGSFDPVYAGYALRALHVRSQIVKMGQGAVRANVGQQNLAKVVTPLPPIPEQRAIASALSDADALIVSLDALIAKKRDIKEAAIQQLLTGKTRLPGFTGKWEVKCLGELAEMGSGGTPPSSVSAYYDGDIPWVSISDMTKGGKIITSTDRNLTRAGFANSAAQMFPAGTVLYAMYASLGECSIAGIPLCSSQAILGIRPGRNLSSQFLYYHLTSQKQNVKLLGQQGTQSNLNKRMVQNFQLKLPSLPEQAAIAAVLTDMDAGISATEVARDKIKALVQGMMQELLTGRIRLV